MTNWIRFCVTSPSFAVLINGEATEFFRSDRGIRQGCPLSLLLFIISVCLWKIAWGRFHFGIKVSRLIKFLHISFVDDVVIMSKASVIEWKEILSLINNFCFASGLSVNPTKTTIHFEGLSEANLLPFKSFLPFNLCALSSGFKYLGYFLKTGPHRASDWDWLVSKFSNKIGKWSHRWLSLGVDIFWSRLC